MALWRFGGPYDFPQELLSKVDKFRTNPPGNWIGNEESKMEFALIYGDEALKYAEERRLVPENMDYSWVRKPCVKVDEGEAKPAPIPTPAVFTTGEQAVIGKLAVIEAKIDALLQR